MWIWLQWVWGDLRIRLSDLVPLCRWVVGGEDLAQLWREAWPGLGFGSPEGLS